MSHVLETLALLALGEGNVARPRPRSRFEEEGLPASWVGEATEEIPAPAAARPARQPLPSMVPRPSSGALSGGGREPPPGPAPAPPAAPREAPEPHSPPATFAESGHGVPVAPAEPAQTLDASPRPRASPPDAPREAVPVPARPVLEVRVDRERVVTTERVERVVEARPPVEAPAAASAPAAPSAESLAAIRPHAVEARLVREPPSPPFSDGGGLRAPEARAEPELPPPPSVEVTIGRVEVRAVLPPPPATAPRARPAPAQAAPDLATYLRELDGR